MGEHERKECQPVATGAESPAEVGTDRSRRKFTAAGLAGTGVLMTLSNRSALGAGFGQCGSESVSAAMSRHGEIAYCGCSPGFWWRSPHGSIKWNNSDIIPPEYGPDEKFNEVFGVVLFDLDKDKTLWELGPGGNQISSGDTTTSCNNIHAIVFHAIAALLNASFYGVRYPAPYQTPESVIGAFQSAFKHSSQCLALNQFKEAVDIYDKFDELWCFNGISSSEDDWSQQY